MSDFDFNNAEPQRAMGELIPENTVALLVINLRPGKSGPGGWLKTNSARDCEMLDLEFTVDGGEHDRRKLWEHWVTAGQTEGQQKAAAITRSKLRAVLESAFGVDPADDSETAMQKRQVSGWGAFDALRICAKIGVEKGGLKNKDAGPNSERYPDKNKVKAILTPGDADYIAPGPQSSAGMQTAGAAVQRAAAKAGGGTAAAAQAAAPAKPSWAS